jgi:hypothetical protein
MENKIHVPNHQPEESDEVIITYNNYDYTNPRLWDLWLINANKI